MIEFLSKNYEWIFSGIGVVIVLALIKIFRRKKKNELNNANSLIVKKEKSDLQELKNKTHILFIDDDNRFKVVEILIQSGWIHTSRMSDVNNLDDSHIQSTNIFFVDIQGVGIKLGFHSEGLGLAEAIKNKYKEKKVVIYSAQTKGERFHKALRIADDFLSKNAEPYEFQQLTERLSKEYWDHM